MVGSSIKQLRLKNNISQKELAQKLGVSRQALCLWESEKRELKLMMINKIAKVFGMTVDDILKLNNKEDETKEGSEMLRKSKQTKVSFELTAPEAKRVLVTGSWNGWDSKGIPMKKERSGTWKVGVNLTPGRHEYKFIVDDQWWNDPINNNTAVNSLGSLNSVMEVTA